MDRATVFPTRLSLGHVEANRSQFPSYVVLPLPPHSHNTSFETIGVTTFKKYITKAYESLQVASSVPFVILSTATTAHIVHPAPKIPDTLDKMNSIQDKFAPSHRKQHHLLLRNILYL